MQIKYLRGKRSMKQPAIDPVLELLCFFSFCISFTSSVNLDGLSLLALKAAISQDPGQALGSWSESETTPCKWAGITCDVAHGNVTSISLSSKNLSGYLPSEIGALSFLTSLDLSNNSFGGPLPHEITTLQYLVHLDISANNFNGSLPESLSNLTHLTGNLNLSYNAFSGEIPTSFGRFPVMVSLDLRHNNLTGKIPQVGSLLNQGPTAFSSNPHLCGFPLSSSCSIPAESQNPSLLTYPQKPLNAGISSDGVVQNRKIKSGMMIIAVISSACMVVGIVSVSAWVIRRKGQIGESKRVSETASRELIGREEGKKGRFVVVDDEFGLELEDLLRASAYVLGKSKSGIVYRVVVSGGGTGGAAVGRPAVMAVRRLSEADSDATWRFKEFEVEVEAIARVQHPNIVKLKAYYYASDEKLLISEFIRNGSLHSALHGTVNNSPPLTWASRLRIAREVASGLMHIHEFSHRKYIHGNIRTSKILLDDDFKPQISGFGLSRLGQVTSRSASAASKKQSLSQTIITAKSSYTYIAPEARSGSVKLTQKCDVYSFGIVLLELLTGRMPDCGDEGLEGLVREVFREERRLAEIIDSHLLPEIDAKKQVVAAFHIALSCTEIDPDLRPRMRAVCDNLDSIKLL